jgi:hypothetical protein
MASMEVNKDTSILEGGNPPSTTQNSYLRIGFITVFATLAAIVFTLLSGLAEIQKNWPKYRCKPQYMALAPVFGKNTAENFDYCMKNVMDKEASGALAPLYKTLALFIGIISTLLNSTNSLRLQLATLVGGIVKVVQQFTDRFTQFQFAIRTSTIRLKSLMYRVYGTVMAVVYMGMSSVTALQNFGDHQLIRFLMVFCFPPETPIFVFGKGHITIKDIQIGDRLAHGGYVTAKFRFAAPGEQMVRLGHVRVSSNHFVQGPTGQWIMAGEHPDAISDGIWTGGAENPLICMNTSDHKIPIGKYIFSDYDETAEGDKLAAEFVEKSINGVAIRSSTTFKEYGALLDPEIQINNKPAREIQLGDILSNGCKVLGVIKKEISEIIELPSGVRISPSTLVWNSQTYRYERAIHIKNAKLFKLKKPRIYNGFIVTPHSYITTDSGLHLRDYIEVLSPFTEDSYSAALKSCESMTH